MNHRRRYSSSPSLISLIIFPVEEKICFYLRSGPIIVILIWSDCHENVNGYSSGPESRECELERASISLSLPSESLTSQG
ncbi:hypothetical protein AVEN_86250-1, partial [Araneus ventricosus]